MDLLAPLNALKDLLTGFFDFVTSIFCVLGNILTNPLNFIAFLMNGILEFFNVILPSTPANMKVSVILQGIGNTFPIVGSGILYEIVSGLGGILAIYLIVKAIKYIPFL